MLFSLSQDFQFWYTAFLVVALSVVLIKEYIETDLAVFSVLILLVIGGVVDINDAFAGFSNQGMLTIGFLFIVAGAMRKTGVVDVIGDSLLGQKGKTRNKLFRLLPPVSTISAFFNNTPIVAMLIPAISSWAKKHNTPVSKFLIPLSYAAILGGTCTLIGTSTNLVIHGLMIEKGMKGLGFFEISWVGVPVAIVGLTTIILVGHKLLPEKKEAIIQMGEHIREFVVVMTVEADYKHIGKSIEEAGLRHLKGLFLFQIERDDRLKTPVGPDEKIRLHDYLFFTGLPDTIWELQKIRGLSLVKKKTFDLENFDSDTYGSFEVVVSPYSPMIGKSVRDCKFRTNFDAVVIAIHRSGERIKQKIGSIVLRGGDTLLILARRDFIKRWYHSRDFYLVSKSIDINSKPRVYSYLSIIIFLLMIIAMASGLLPIIVASSGAAVLLLLTRCITPAEARNSIDFQVLLIIASAFGIARGLENSGIAHFLAENIISSIGTWGTLGLLAGTYIITNIYTEIITNNAAAALLFPIVAAVAGEAHLDPRPFFLAVAIGASASFATPIGYQTNLMVYGPGGYRFKDFLKAGIPMNVIIGVTAITALYLLYFN